MMRARPMSPNHQLRPADARPRPSGDGRRVTTGSPPRRRHPIGWLRAVPWWVWISATPLGLGAWAPLIPGRELRRRSWIAWGVLWIAVTVAGWVAATADERAAAGG